MTFNPTDRFQTEENRDNYFTPGNDELWGKSNWVKCERCPDHNGNPSYHHKEAHL